MKNFRVATSDICIMASELTQNSRPRKRLPHGICDLPDALQEHLQKQYLSISSRATGGPWWLVDTRGLTRKPPPISWVDTRGINGEAAVLREATRTSRALCGRIPGLARWWVETCRANGTACMH